MGFKLMLEKKATKDLEQLDPLVARRIIKKLRWFIEQPDLSPFIVKMKQPASGDVRFRIGDYRAVGIVVEKQSLLVILSIGHRSEIYRR
jgi:mRNA interferase RelE/StbE